MDKNKNNRNNGDNNSKQPEFGRKPDIVDADVETSDVEPLEEADEATVETVTEEGSELEALKNLLNQKEQEVEKEKKEYLFLMAEFDNFRKRTVRERADLIKNAAEKALRGILPILDDFERGLEAIRDSSDAEAVKEGMQLIYNKFLKYLADNNVQPMQSTGAAFDPDLHEAVAMVPAASDDEKGKVKDTVQKGYTLGDKVLRHAKVVVAQ